jgi:hypothetical protein
MDTVLGKLCAEYVTRKSIADKLLPGLEDIFTVSKVREMIDIGNLNR